MIKSKDLENMDGLTSINDFEPTEQLGKKEQLEKTIVCLHQLIRPKTYVAMEKHGNCITCVKDYQNKECVGYTPINFVLYNVNK